MRWLGVAEWVVNGLGGEQVAELSLASGPACSTWSGGLVGGGRAWAERRRGCWPTWSRQAAARPGRRRPALPPGRGDPAVAGHDHLAPRSGPAPPGRRPVRLLRHRRGAHPGGPPPVAPTTSAGWSPPRSPSAGTSCPAARPAQVLGAGLAKRFLGLGVGDDQARDELDRAAAAVPPGSGGLARGTCSTTGRRSRGSAPTRPALVWRAALEAGPSAASTARPHRVGRQAEPAAGAGRGWAKNPAARSVKRAVLGPFWPQVTEAGPRGALAGIASGCGGIDELPGSARAAPEPR